MKTVRRSTPAPGPGPVRAGIGPCRLRLGRGAWELTFGGGRAVLRDQRAVGLIALLLESPGHPYSPLELASRALARFGPRPKRDPLPQAPLCLALQARQAVLDDMGTARAYFRKRKELAALIEDEGTPEPVRAEAEEELAQIEAWEGPLLRRTRDHALRAADAVRKAMGRFLVQLRSARDAGGRPHPVLGAFAAHLDEHLSRVYGPGGQGAVHYQYDPPPGMSWE